MIIRRKRKASEKPTYVHWGKGCASSKPFLPQSLEQEALIGPKLWASEAILSLSNISRGALWSKDAYLIEGFSAAV